MKKKLIILLTIVGMLMSTAVVTAATGTSIKATLTKLQVYFGSNKLSGSVISYKNVNYIPVKTLSDKLEYDISTNSSKIVITEDESKDDLRNEIKGFEKQIKDMNKQLDVYRGYIPDDSAYKSISDLYIIDDDKLVYQSFWNKVTPFKINGEIYDKKTYGIFFDGRNYEHVCIASFEFKNPELEYSKFKFSCAVDDLGIALQNNTETSVIVKGYSNVLGNNTLLDKIIDRDNGIEILEVDIKGYDKIAIEFWPSYIVHYQYFSPHDYDIVKDYVLLINPEVK